MTCSLTARPAEGAGRGSKHPIADDRQIGGRIGLVAEVAAHFGKTLEFPVHGAESALLLDDAHDSQIAALADDDLLFEER